MKDYFSKVAVQATSIIIAAAGAALLTFFQSLATSTGVCTPPVEGAGTAGALGALIKAGHSVLATTSTKSIL